MNLADIIVIVVIALYALVGYAKGFVFSVFKVASFFVSAFLSILAYPHVSNFLISSVKLDQQFKESIGENISKIITPEQIAKGAGTQPVTDMLNSWGIPKPIENMIVDNLAVQVSNSKESIVDVLSSSLSVIAVNIISIIAVFIVISIILFFARNIFEGIAKLPIFKQVNKVGGLIFGGIEGLLIVYIVFAILSVFVSFKDLHDVFATINSSVIAKQMFANNLLLIWAFGKK